MKIILDTNVIIDNLARRDEYGESLRILNLCENGTLSGVITTTTIMDVMYILRKHLESGAIKDAVQMLMQIVDVAPVLKSDINDALSGGCRDFEDAVISNCATRVKADYIVTRNVRDFGESSVPAVTPSDMLKLLRSA